MKLVLRFFPRRAKAGAVLAALVFAALSALSVQAAQSDGQSLSQRTSPALDEEDVLVFEDVEVRARRQEQDSGSTQIPPPFIEKLPQGHGDVTDLLRIFPSVQFSESYRSAATAGEIAPAEVSISGGKPYQNLFLLDGMSNSSLLDPGQGNAYLAADVSGHAQKFFVDTSIVESLRVYDSNVPASYDNFMGGIVEVKTKNPGLSFGGDISYRTTRSSWTHFFTDDTKPAATGGTANVDLQPRFEKHHFSTTLNVPVTEDTGLLVNYKRLESSIPVKYFSGWKEQERKSETFFLKGVHYLDDSSHLEFSGAYAPYTARHFTKNTRNSYFTVEGGGYFAAAAYHRARDDNQLKFQTNYSYSENSRNAPTDFKAWLASPNKPWGFELPLATDASGNLRQPLSNEGGWGSIDKQEEAVSVSLDHTPGRFEMLGIHRLSYGLRYSHITGRFHRLTDAATYQDAVWAPEVNCNGDVATCVDSEQYFSRRTLTPASDVSAAINDYSAYLEDDWSAWRLRLRFGLRGSYDDFQQNLNVSPRTLLQYDLFGNRRTVLSSGYNRYYSAALLANKLREGRRPSSIEKRGTHQNVLQDWEASTDGTKVSYSFEDLKTPYSDEYMVGIDQAFMGGYLNLKYLERQSRNEFARHRGDAQADGIVYWRLNNNGKSEFRSVQIKWDRSWRRHYLLFNAFWQESKTSNDSYDKTFDLEDLDTQVIFAGKLIPLAQMPKDNFNRPIIVNLAYTGRFFDRLSISPVVKYRGSYRQIQITDRDYFLGFGAFDPITGEQTKITTNAYEVVKQDAAVTLDCALAWTQSLGRSHQVTFTLEVFNVLNARHQEGKSYTTGETPDSYELGRQFWAGVGYSF